MPRCLQNEYKKLRFIKSNRILFVHWYGNEKFEYFERSEKNLFKSALFRLVVNFINHNPLQILLNTGLRQNV